MKLLITKDTANVTLLIFIQDSSSTTGAGNTGLLATNLTAYYSRVEDDNDVTVAAISLSDLTGTGTVHTDGGLEEIATTNMPGWYRLDIPDAVVASGARSAGISIIDSGANDVAQVTIEIQLVDVDLEDTVRMGMTALPNAAAEAAGGLYTRGTGAGQINQDANGRADTNIAAVSSDTASADNLELDYDGTGYNKSNSTIGTTTTNTDVRGTDSAALASVLGAAVGADISADIAAVKAETVLIVADTNELQGDWADAGRLDAILDNILTDTGTTLDDHLTDIKGTSFVKDTHSLIDIKTETALIVVDTNELQADWTNTGRLDTILDSILEDTGTTLDNHLTDIKGTAFVKDTHSLIDILTDTAVIGALGAGLSNIPWNASWDVEVESEVADALAAINLDELIFSPVTTDFITAVDPDSVIGWLAHDGTGTGTGGGGFNRTTESLEAIRDNMQVAVDAAIDTAISELGVAAPTATPTLRTGLMLLYMTLRNQTIVQTSGTDALEIYNDAGTLIAQKLLTDDGSDYTEAEMVSG